MEVYEIAYVFLGLATLVAAGTIINYSRKRSAASPDPDIKAAFRPLYLFSIGLLVFGIGALLTFLFFVLNNEDFPWARESFVRLHNPYLRDYTIFYVFTLVELFFLTIAAGMILKQRLISVFMAIMILIAFLLVFYAILIVEDVRTSNVAEFYINFGNVLSVILLSANAALFSWIAYDTRRSTSMALGYAMIVQVLAVPRLYAILPIELIFAITVFALMGPAMIAFAFLRPDQKISVELLGYGATFAGPVVIIASLISAELVSNLSIVIIAVFGAIAMALATGTASYTYGRWRDTRQLPTALLMVIFAAMAAGQMIGLLGTFEALPNIWSIYFDFVATSFALAVFTSVGILAAGYRTLASLPLLLYVPTALLMTQRYPAPISQAFMDYAYLAVPSMLVFFVPVFLFAGAWRRMKKAGTAGRMRPLGMSMGLLLFLIIRVAFLLADIQFGDPGYALVAIPFAVLWLSITGRLDRY
ncbi:MAG: hypothetical protein C4K48_04100 [Candidatus Thorarchaeota archaeon]|nr:MAG: hypothetical protein C4K48_04100 [Candidatus Thorarchaeota archaeon]